MLDDIIEGHALDGAKIELDETFVTAQLDTKLACCRLGNHHPAAFEGRAYDAVRTPGDEPLDGAARLFLTERGHAFVSSPEKETLGVRMRLGMPHEQDPWHLILDSRRKRVRGRIVFVLRHNQLLPV